MSGRDEQPLKVKTIKEILEEEEAIRITKRCSNCGSIEFYRDFTDYGVATINTQDGFDCDYNYTRLEWQSSWKCSSCDVNADEELSDWLDQQN